MKIAVVTTDNRQHFRTFNQPAPSFGTAPEALLQGFARLPELEVHVISCAQKPMKSPEKLADNIWFHSLYVPKHGWLRTSYQGCIRSVRRQLKAIRPDIVHGQGTERECAISAALSKFPSVVTIHGNMRLIAELTKAKPLSFNWLAAQLEKITLPRTAGVVCITRYTQDAVKDLARKTWLVPNAVDASFFDVEATRADTDTILCVGFVCYRKNQNEFIRSLDALAGKRKLKVRFFGEAPKEDPYVAEFFQLLESRPWCSYEGFIDREKLKAQMRTAGMVALPSLEDNCPMVVLEAMAAGVPVLAAKVGGVPDLVEDGKNGLLCDPQSRESMAAGVRRLLEETQFAGDLVRSSKQIALERFHPLNIAQRHVEIYREVLSKPS